MFLTASTATCSSQGRLTAGEGQTETVASMGDWHLTCEWRQRSSAIPLFPTLIGTQDTLEYCLHK